MELCDQITVRVEYERSPVFGDALPNGGSMSIKRHFPSGDAKDVADFLREEGAKLVENLAKTIDPTPKP